MSFSAYVFYTYYTYKYTVPLNSNPSYPDITLTNLKYYYTIL